MNPDGRNHRLDTSGSTVRLARLFAPSLLLTALCALPLGARDATAGTEIMPEGGPAWQRDRGPGMPTSMFGTYIRKGELLVYPFFEYYLENTFDYVPSDLGYGGSGDFQGKYRASEEILFASYGFTDWLAMEFEASTIQARFERDPADLTGTPDVIEESGIGDIEGQVRARLVPETEKHPELFTYFEAVSPQEKDKPLIGTPDWELKFGVGAVRGFAFGTVTARFAGEYLLEDSSLDTGEYALEYLRKLSSTFRLYGGFEGNKDELTAIVEAQWHFSRHAFLKVNNGFGVTEKATDWAPEVGVLFSFPTGQ